METTSVFAPIMKSAEQDDGTLLVYGKATDDSLDLDGQRCDKSWLSEAVPAWFGTGTGVGGNIRAQHRADSAIGKAIEHEEAEDGHYITARIVDRDAIAKTKAGVFTGFSIGIKSPRIVKSPSAPNGVINSGMITEISLVDRPANGNCTLMLTKAAKPGMELNAADYDEATGLVKCEELVETPDATEKAVDVEQPADAGLTASLADRLPPGQVEKLAAVAEPATVVEEPAPAEDPTEKSVDVETPADVAKALVADAITKADSDDMDGGFAGPDDETLGAFAISVIARLIQSEAGGMVSNPNEDDDIRCLLSAVASLRWYLRRERQEGDIGGMSDAAPYEYAAAATPDEKPAAEVVVKAADGEIEKAAKAAVDEAFGELADSVTRPRGINGGDGGDGGDAPAAEPITKTTDADTVKAAVVEDEDPGDALVKALTAALSKADNPLRASFEAIVKASTDAIQESAETTAEAVSDLAARLVKVESMATPGGPALRRTEVERTNARRTDLMVEAARLRSLEANTHDQTLVKGYRLQADALEAEIKAIAV
jgi:hypothetical protein